MEGLNKWQKKYFDDMLEIARNQIYEEAKKKRKLFKEDDYIIYALFRKLTAGQAMSLIDELIEEGIYPLNRSENRYSSKNELARFIIHRKLPGYKEINEFWMYHPNETDNKE
jgi:hypothetical protein